MREETCAQHHIGLGLTECARVLAELSGPSYFSPLFASVASVLTVPGTMPCRYWVCRIFLLASYYFCFSFVLSFWRFLIKHPNSPLAKFTATSQLPTLSVLTLSLVSLDRSQRKERNNVCLP